TALTVTLNGTETACATGLPVLPEGVPGTAVSPGARSCNLVNAPAVTANTLLTALLRLAQEAVSCLSEPATFSCRLVNVITPLPAFVPMSSVRVPSNVPAPEESVTVTGKLPGRPAVRLLP